MEQLTEKEKEYSLRARFGIPIEVTNQEELESAIGIAEFWKGGIIRLKAGEYGLPIGNTSAKL